MSAKRPIKVLKLTTQSVIQLDLPLKLQVFLTNRQQDLQMLNSTKLSFFGDTLYVIKKIRLSGFTWRCPKKSPFWGRPVSQVMVTLLARDCHAVSVFAEMRI